MARSDCGQRRHILISKVSLQSCQRTGLHLLPYSPDMSFRGCATAQYSSIKDRVHKPASIFYFRCLVIWIYHAYRSCCSKCLHTTADLISATLQNGQVFVDWKCPSLAEMTTVLEAISSDGIMAEAGNSPRERREGRPYLHFEQKCLRGGGNEFWQCLRLARSPSLEFGFDLGEDKSTG